MSAWTLYWIITLDSVNMGLGALTLLFSVVVVCIGLHRVITEDSDFTKPTIRAVVIFAIIGALAVLVPTTKQALTIMGVSYVTQNERVEKNVDNVLDYFEATLDKKLSEVKK